MGEKVKDVLVTGATGGGSIAVMVLSKWVTMFMQLLEKKQTWLLKRFRSKKYYRQKEFQGESKLLEKGIWDGVVTL